MGFETESEEGSGKQCITRSAWCAPFCSVNHFDIHATVLSSLTFAGKNKQDRRVDMSFGDQALYTIQ